MFDLILKAIRSLFNKYDKKIADAVEESKRPSWGNVQNKPFENNQSNGELLKTTVYFGEEQAKTFSATSARIPIMNEMYTVNWNGTDYECMAVNPDSSLFDGAVVLGDLSIFGISSPVGSGNPFIIAFTADPDNADNAQIIVFRLDSSESASITITGTFGELKQLNEQFLQESAKSALYIHSSRDTMGNLRLASPGDYYKIAAAVEAGRTVYLAVGNEENINAVFAGYDPESNSHFDFLGVSGRFENGILTGRYLNAYVVGPDGNIREYEL